MTEEPFLSGEIRAYLIRLENPYAKLSILDPSNEELPSAAEKRRAYIKRLENPWAKEGLVEEEFPEEGQPLTSMGHIRPQRITKEEFRETCRRLFAPYAPAGSRSLIPDHRDFIARNENNSPERRFMLLEELKKYDIGSSGQFQTWFNREPKFFTLEKLKRIEEQTQQLSLL